MLSGGGPVAPGFRVQYLGFWVQWSSGVSGSVFRGYSGDIEGFGFSIQNCRVLASKRECCPCLGFRVLGFGFRVTDVGFRNNQRGNECSLDFRERIRNYITKEG